MGHGMGTAGAANRSQAVDIATESQTAEKSSSCVSQDNKDSCLEKFLQQLGDCDPNTHLHLVYQAKRKAADCNAETEFQMKMVWIQRNSLPHSEPSDTNSPKL